MSYSFLKPVRIGNMVLKNRVIVPAMARYLCKDGYVTDAYVEYLRAIAEGGVAMVTVGIMPIDLNWPSTMPTQPCLGDDKYIPGLTRAVAAIHAGGAKASLQPWMPGRAPYTYANAVERAQDIAIVNRLTVDEIHNIQKKYAAAALRCAMAGADVVEWHNAHNYLGEQFFSPYFNHRTDEYGQQSVENSMRFAREALALTRRTLDAAGYSHVELIAKLNGSEIINDDITPELLAASAKELEKAGIALITVNGGGVMSRLTGMSADGNWEEGWKVPYAEVVKNSVSIPVAACGSLRHPDYIDSIIRDGKCDAVALGRQLFAEPEFCSKIAQGREDELKYCVSCMHCLTKTPFGPQQPGCTMNPRGRREYCMPAQLNINGDHLPVAVIGAGPAGLEAAVTLTKRGFDVTVFEKSDRIGGAVNLADAPIGKYKLGWLIDYYERMIRKLGIRVQLNTECTPQMLRAMDPYAVFVATGSDEFIPPIDGLSGENVLSVREYIRSKPAVSGKRVVVLGAGQTGLEAARMLAQDNTVTVVDMMPDEIPANTDHRLDLFYAKDAGVQTVLGHRILRVDGAGVTVASVASGEERVLPADLVVVALGVRPVAELYNEIKDAFPHVCKLGDSVKPGFIVHATTAAYEAAASLPTKPYEVKEVYFAAEKEAVRPQLINPYA